MFIYITSLQPVCWCRWAHMQRWNLLLVLTRQQWFGSSTFCMRNILCCPRITQWRKAHTTIHAYTHHTTPHCGEKHHTPPQARHKRFDCVCKQLTFAHSGEERLQAEYPVVIAQWPETWHKKCRNVKLQKHKKAKDKHHQIQAVDSFIYYIDWYS